MFEVVRRKVRVFTPDGAADEQLAGRLTSEVFPNMAVVLRCATHAISGALKAGWAADLTAKQVTKEVVQEVAKYVRSSERFAMTVGAKAAEGLIAELENFSFAPQRFSSRDRPLTRFVVFGVAVMEALALEVDIPTSAERAKWARSLLRQLTSETWCVIGMLADLCDDCARFVHRLDVRTLDPIQAAVVLEEFRTMLRAEYIQGDMWRRRTATFTARVMQMLDVKKVVRFGGEYVVLRRPTAEEATVCQARVANVARGIIAYMRGQFPSFSTQALFRCLHLDGDASRAADLNKLLGIFGWDAERARACVMEYEFAWPRAVTAKRRDSLDDRDAWATIVSEVHPQLAGENLKRVVCIMLSFLVSETEAERSFSLERLQTSRRPKLGGQSRFAGLKIMCDGLPFSDLVDPAGNPLSNFWDLVQERYAQTHGTRCFRTDLTVRKDKGCQWAKGRLRKGKETLTSVKRARVQVVSSAVVAGSVSVFGYPCVASRKLKEACVAEETEQFQRLLNRAKQKWQQQKTELDEARASGQRLCVLPDRKRSSVLKASAKRRNRAARSSLSGQKRISWRAVRRHAGGDTPWVFVSDTDSLPSGKLDHYYGGTPLRGFSTSDIGDWQRRVVQLDRRVILVARIECLAWRVVLAAMIYGAHVREELLAPMIRYKLLSRCVAVFSKFRPGPSSSRSGSA